MPDRLYMLMKENFPDAGLVKYDKRHFELGNRNADAERERKNNILPAYRGIKRIHLKKIPKKEKSQMGRVKLL